MRFLSSLVVFVLALSASPLFADVVSAGAVQVLLPVNGSIYGITSVVATARDGRSMVVSSGALLVGGTTFNAFFFDRFGQQVATPFVISFPAGQSAYSFDIGVSSSGFMLVYDATPNAAAGNNREVFFRQYSFTGQLLASGQANTLTTLDESRPSCTGLATGGYAITWVRRPLFTPGASQGIYLRRFDGMGMAVDTTEVRVDAVVGNFGAQDAPVISAWPAGQMVVVWLDGPSNGSLGQSSPDNFGQAIVARFLSSTLQPASAINLVVNSITANDQFDPRVDADDRNTCIIGWCGETTPAQVDGYSRRFNSSGLVLDATDTLLTPTNTTSQYLTSVGMSSNGEGTAVWMDGLSTPGQPAPRNSFARLSQQGTLIESNFVEAGGTVNETHSIPKIGVDEYGNILCAYSVSLFTTTSQPTLRVRRLARTCITPGSATLPLGGSLSLILSLPSDANRPYVLAASAGQGPLPVDTRLLRLNWDLILNLSVFQGGGGVFYNFIDILGPGGYSSMPAVIVPNLPSLVGLNITFAVATGLTTAPSGVNTFSDNLVLQIQ
ncbi:MAG: hypothetical protein EXS14_05570 [Planctomycetes bacterium]|nr:hypothetical protein [Planctomycetota bacterium]